MRTILLAGCAAVLLIGSGAAMAQTGTPAEPSAREAPAPETAQEAPAPAAPAEPSQAAPEQSAPARSLHAQEQRPSEPDLPPSALDSAPPPAPDSAPPPPAQEAAPAMQPPPARGRAADRRRACRLQARQLGLRGPDATGHIAICMAEARLACTKEAVARTPDRRARNDYIRNCLGMAERPPR